MSPEAIQVPEPRPAGLGTFARITGVFFEPGKTFEDIGRHPSWFVPLLLVIVATLAYNISYGQHVGWERFMQQQIANSPRVQAQIDQIPADQRESQMALRAKITGISQYVASVVIMPIVILISSAILLGLTAMMGAGLRYKQVFAVSCFAGVPIIIKHLLSIVVVFLKKPDDFNLLNPLAFNFAAFMDQTTASKFLYTVALSFDLFAIWVMLLTATGLAAAAGRKRLSFGGAMVAVAVPWVVFVLLGASMAAAFS